LTFSAIVTVFFFAIPTNADVQDNQQQLTKYDEDDNQHKKAGRRGKRRFERGSKSQKDFCASYLWRETALERTLPAR